MRGTILMLTALTLFAALDTAGKLLAGDGFQYAQVVSMRYAPVLLVVLPALALRPSHFRGNTGLQMLRGAGMLCASLGFFTAFTYLPLAEGYLVFFTSPFITMAASRLVLKETVPASSWIWAGVAFVGVLIGISSGLRGDGPWYGYAAAFGGSLAYACIATINRLLRSQKSMLPMLLWPGLIGGLSMGPVAFLTWKTPDAGQLVLLLLNGMFWAAATLCIVNAFRYAPASRLAPLEYASLLWAVLVDYVVFHSPPSLHVLMGGAVVIGACLMNEHAQHRAQRKIKAA